MSTSSRFTDLMMRMFVRGRTAVPAAGMQALPELLAGGLTIDVQRPATAVGPSEVQTSDGTLRARAVVVATPADMAAVLVPGLRVPSRKGVSTIYHAAAQSPLDEPTLIVDAEPSPISNTVVMTEAASSYSSDGRGSIRPVPSRGNTLRSPRHQLDTGRPRFRPKGRGRRSSRPGCRVVSPCSS